MEATRRGPMRRALAATLLCPVLLPLPGMAAMPATTRLQARLFGSPIELLAAAPAAAALAAALQLLTPLDREWNAWKQGALGRQNRQLRDGREVQVPQPLRALIVGARALEWRSGGLFNPAIGGLVGTWGFHDDVVRPGTPPVHPQTEDYWGNVNPIGPRGVYDEAKRFQEAITMAYHTYHQLETRIVRIFNTYGPRMRLNDGRVLPAFIGQALRGEDLTIFGDGSQTRSFCYVDDLIEGIYRLLMSDYAYPVNIGNPDEITIRQFEEIIRLTGTTQKLIMKPLPQDDPKQRQPDISRAREILGWAPKVQRAEGLKITYAYFKNLPKEELYKTAHPWRGRSYR